MALSFVNQIGAVEGMNQAAPGTLIPESFVRWSQDALFDRAGLIRRRGPFDKFATYQELSPNIRTDFDPTSATASDERILGVFSTYTPKGVVRIGMLVHIINTSGVASASLRVFDNYFTYLGEEILPFTPERLSIVSAKPALGGGLWVSIASDPADADTHYQFFWRGGHGPTIASAISTPVARTGTFDEEAITGFNPEHGGLSEDVVLDSLSGVSEGQFVYATISGNDHYVGTVKSVPSSGTTVTLDKRPFIWDTTTDNNHSVIFTNASASSSTSVVTITLSSSVLFEVDDVIYLTSASNANYNNLVATITAVPPTTAANTFTFNTTFNRGTASDITVHMNNDLIHLNKANVSLKFISVRPYEHLHGRGLLNILNGDTNALTSGNEGTSADGHWLAAKVANYNLYRASDNAYLGKVNTVTDNATAALNSDPGISLNGEEYIMHYPSQTDLVNDYKVSNRNALTFAGLYTTVYAGYQWFGNLGIDDNNTNRVVFSAAHDHEAVDLSRDAADSIIFPGKSKFRGLASSSAGLLVFLEDRTYILRGNDRVNFSVEQLVPEGCLCPTSVVEYGGGVFWAGKSGIMYFDGASVRNLTKDNLGSYYTDSLDEFNPEQDRVMGFIHKNNLIMHYTSWKSPFDPVRYEPIYAADWQTTEGIADRSWDEFDPDFDYDDFFTQNNTPIFWDRKILNNPEESASTGRSIKWDDGSVWGNTSSLNKYGPLRQNTTITFNVYLPTNSITTLSNMDFRGVTSAETLYGLKTIVGVNSVESISGVNKLRARLIDIHPVFDIDTNGEDALLVEKLNIPYADSVKGPDLYIQSKHFTVGDPILRKWFQRVLLSMLLYDGAMRMDLVDDDDNDDVDINKKKHKNWEIFTEKGYDWDYLGKGEGNDFGVVFPKLTSPNKSNWENVEGTVTYWSELFTSDFNRYSKRISWRKTSAGFRLYQLNDYKKPFEGVVTRPNRVDIQGFSIGFKPLRQGRI